MITKNRDGDFRVSAIWAQDNEGVIGCDGRIPWHCPVDLRHFRSVTMGATLIVGRKTAETLPKSVHEGRQVLVVSRSGRSLVQAFREAGRARIMIVGGGEIYRACLGLCDTVYRTIMNAFPSDYCAPDAELTFAPQLPIPDWDCETIDYCYKPKIGPSLTIQRLTRRRQGAGSN